MPEVNIDEICEPIKVTVGGKEYTVVDISRETARKMSKLDTASEGTEGLDHMAGLLAEVLNADPDDMAKLGMRKLMKTITSVMGIINEEIEGKNVQGAVAAK